MAKEASMNLELFMTTMREYNRFAKQLPLSNDEPLFDTHNEAMYIAVQTRLILLRKYVSKNKYNNVYIDNLIVEAKERFPQKTFYLNEMIKRFSQINQRAFEQILSDGTKLNIYQSVEDVLYGFYLHADREKISRLSCTNETMRFFYTRKYVEEVEIIVLELFDFLEKNNVWGINEMEHMKAPIIHLGESNFFSQDITLSPYWKNLYGSDLTQDDINSLVKEISKDDAEILTLVNLFISELSKEKISVETLKSFVFKSTLEQWGNFAEVVSLYNKIPSPGMSSVVRYNENKDTAYVRILPNVEGGFIVSSPHVISDVYNFTLLKDTASNEWKVFSFGSPIDPIIRE